MPQGFPPFLSFNGISVVLRNDGITLFLNSVWLRLQNESDSRHLSARESFIHEKKAVLHLVTHGVNVCILFKLLFNY